jgi:hypothetical protein
MHSNLGHPTTQELVKLLLSQGAKSSVISAANSYRCASCVRNKSTAKPNPSKMPHIGQFNDVIQMDIVHITAANGYEFGVLGIIDEATLYHVAGVLKNRKPETVAKAVDDMWIRPFGVPACIACDQDGCFGGYFVDRVTAMSIELRQCPAEAHWQIGTIERHNFALKTMAHKVIDAVSAITEQQVDEAVIQSCAAKNMLLRRAGRSPAQGVFGRIPRLPGALLTDEANALSFVAMSRDEKLTFSDKCRLESLKAFAEFEGNVQIKRSMLRQARRTVFEPVPGQRVAFWTKQSRKGLRRTSGKDSTRRPGYLVGTVVAVQPDGECNLWVSHGGRLYYVTKQQCRPAVGFENWVPTPEYRGTASCRRSLSTWRR